jgi:arylsulfatase A-like enzyme
VALACAVVLGLGCSGESKQRIVLITIDTLRYDGLESGDASSRMPITAALARRGQRFQEAYSASSVTQPTHASLFTGQHPWVHGVPRNGAWLADQHETVAERLRAVGFTTAAVVGSFPLDARFGFAQGFDRYSADFTVVAKRDWEGEPVKAGRFFSRAEDVTERALSMIDQSEGDRQFFWFHYFDPHDPYGDSVDSRIQIGHLEDAGRRGGPEALELVREARRLYDEDLGALDRSLDRLFIRLAADEDVYPTAIVFTADHGESFGEYGTVGHGKRVTKSQVHVPLFIVAPGLPPAERQDTVGSIDVAATLLAMGGASVEGLPGRDLRGPPARDAAAFGMRDVFAKPIPEYLLDGRVLPVEGLRFFAVQDGQLLAGDASSITHGDDPSRPARGARADRTRALFADFGRTLADAQTVELLDPETQAALEALGYVR